MLDILDGGVEAGMRGEACGGGGLSWRCCLGGVCNVPGTDVR